jgi:hypothetical protein
VDLDRSDGLRSLNFRADRGTFVLSLNLAQLFENACTLFNLGAADVPAQALYLGYIFHIFTMFKQRCGPISRRLTPVSVMSEPKRPPIFRLSCVIVPSIARQSQ